MYSVQIETSDGTLTRVNLGIQYFEKDDITVYRNEAEVPLVQGTDWQWDGDSTIVLLKGAEPVGNQILVFRNTDKDRAFNIYDGGAPFSRDTLDENFKQMIYLAQEFTEGSGISGLYRNLNMHGNRIINLGDPMAALDAANKKYVDAQDVFYDTKQTNWNTQQDAEIAALKAGVVDQTAHKTVPWMHVAVGGETTISPPFVFQSALVFINGVNQYELGNAYSIADNTVTLAEPLLQGDEVLLYMGSRPAAPNEYLTVSEVDAMIQQYNTTAVGYMGGPTLQTQVTGVRNDTNYILADKKTIVDSSSRVAYKYAAFCDATLSDGVPTFVHREGLTHLDDGGGNSRIVISRMRDDKIVPVFTLNAITGKDYRDPSITYCKTFRRLVVSVQLYDVASGVYDGGTVFIFDKEAALLLNTTYVSASGYFQWGKVIRSPDNKMMLLAYSVTGGSVGLFKSTGLFDNPTSFIKITDLFVDSTYMSNEASLLIWKGLLVVVARTQLKADSSYRNLRVLYTGDLSGTSGWSTVREVPSATGVAPRLTAGHGGELYITFGGIVAGSRSNVVSTTTYDATTFSVPNTLLSATTDGGYHGVILTAANVLQIYTYNETEHLLRSNTYYQEVLAEKANLNIIPPADVTLNYTNGVTYAGEPAFGSTPTAVSGYVSFYVPKPISNCTGLVVSLTASAAQPAQQLELRTSTGTLYASMGAITVTGPGVYTSQRTAISIPVGLYRLTIAGSSICYSNIPAALNARNVPRLYTPVGVDTMNTSFANDVFIGFII